MSEELLIRHPPERHRPSPPGVTVYAGCCCLMILHTAGALVGAGLGGGWRRRPADLGFDPERKIPGLHWLFEWLPRTQWVFWSSLAGVVAATLPLCLVTGGLNPIDMAADAAFLFLWFGPLYLLVAWLVSVIRLWLRPAGTVPPDEFRALHRMLRGTVLGMVAGFLVSFVCLGLLVYIGVLQVYDRSWLAFP